ncbi:MAG: EAL domain-containing protein, partial [Spirulinaceae cyanobacterium]
TGKNLDIAKTIITLAHSLGLDAIAEGVETQEQLETLQLLGCDCAQGYLISRPIQGQAVVDLIKKVNT